MLTPLTRHGRCDTVFAWQACGAECQCCMCRCAYVYKRHSRSIDTDRMACGMCSGRLAFKGRFQPDGTPAKTRAPSAFAGFVKEHFAGVKAAHPAGPPMGLSSLQVFTQDFYIFPHGQCIAEHSSLPISCRCQRFRPRAIALLRPMIGLA